MAALPTDAPPAVFSLNGQQDNRSLLTLAAQGVNYFLRDPRGVSYIDSGFVIFAGTGANSSLQCPVNFNFSNGVVQTLDQTVCTVTYGYIVGGTAPYIFFNVTFNNNAAGVVFSVLGVVMDKDGLISPPALLGTWSIYSANTPPGPYFTLACPYQTFTLPASAPLTIASFNGFSDQVSFSTNTPGLIASGTGAVGYAIANLQAISPGPTILNLVAKDVNNANIAASCYINVNTTASQQTVTQTINSNPTGRSITVDSGTCTTLCQLQWVPASTHNVSVPSPQTATGAQYTFTGWANGAPAAGAAPGTFTANFTTQYQLTTSVNPAGAGTITPASGGWYNTGQSVSITATANTGYTFTNFTGCYVAATQSCTMTGPQTVTANFNGAVTLTVIPTPPERNGNPVGEATYLINVSAPANSTTQLSLPAGELPAGSTYSFSANSVTGSGTTVLTVKNATAMSKYSFHAQGTNGTATSAPMLSLTPMVGSTPAAMIDPWGTLPTCTPTFVWDSGVGTTRYNLLVGSFYGGSDYSGDNGSGITPNQFASVTLPTSNGPVYVSLGSEIGGGWQYNYYTYPYGCAVPPPDIPVTPSVAYLISAPIATVRNDSVGVQYAYILKPDGVDVNLIGVGTSCMVSGPSGVTAQVSGHATFGGGIWVTFAANSSATPGNSYTVLCQFQHPTLGTRYFYIADGVIVTDPTPVITSVVDTVTQKPSVIAPGQSGNLTINGRNFGPWPSSQSAPNALVFTSKAANLCSQGSDITYSASDISDWEDSKVVLKVQACGGASGTYEVQVNRGAGGSANGFYPQGTTTSNSAKKPALQVQSSVSLPITVFLIHGIGQSSSDMIAFQQRLTQRLNADGYDSAKVVVDASYSWPCASKANCDSACGINSGAALLASTVEGATMPGQQVVLVGYSMGGLIARDMLAHAPLGNAWNPTGYPDILQRKIAALITLGTPNLGYPWAPVDDVGTGPIAGVCPFQTAQMSSDFRRGQGTPNPTFIPHLSLIQGSDYLRQLTSDWNANVFTSSPLNAYWYAISGSYTSNAVRFSGGSATSYGCPDYNPWSDGIVCDQSSRYQLQDPDDPATNIPQAVDVLLNSKPGNPPDSSYAAPGFVHTTQAVMCPSLPCPWPTNTPSLLYAPPTGSPVMNQVVNTIEGYR